MVFFGIKSIIGPGCVVHVDTFLKELDNLEKEGIPAKKLVHVASNAHLITDFHRAEDGKDEEIGTTKRGNGPAYRDKYGRKGVRATEDPRLQPYIISMYHELYENDAYNDIKILLKEPRVLVLTQIGAITHMSLLLTALLAQLS